MINQWSKAAFLMGCLSVFSAGQAAASFLSATGEYDYGFVVNYVTDFDGNPVSGAIESGFAVHDFDSYYQLVSDPDMPSDMRFFGANGSGVLEDSSISYDGFSLASHNAQVSWGNITGKDLIISITLSGAARASLDNSYAGATANVETTSRMGFYGRSSFDGALGQTFEARATADVSGPGNDLQSDSFSETFVFRLGKAVGGQQDGFGVDFSAYRRIDVDSKPNFVAAVPLPATLPLLGLSLLGLGIVRRRG